jgi:hypothetical protein
LDHRRGCHPRYVNGFLVRPLADLEGGADESGGGFEEGMKLQIMFFR